MSPHERDDRDMMPPPPSSSRSRRNSAVKQELAANFGMEQPSAAQGVDDSMATTSDFVKKLYKYVLIRSSLELFCLYSSRMLDDPSIVNVVSWGPTRDCFVVKDMNEFTKSILPRMFKHSNFASFVRQLNKYDFHKV
jgi:osomolarity two-component system response regulator SKN7